MHAVLQQAVDRVKGHVVNQVRYIQPTHRRSYKYDQFAMDMGADEVTDKEVEKMLEGKSILSDRALLRLIKTTGLATIYDEDGWIDDVAEYIVAHRADCRQVWEHIEQLGKGR